MVKNVEERRRLKRTDATNTISRARQNLSTRSKDGIKTLLTRLDNLRLDLKELDATIFDKIVDAGISPEESEAEYQSCVTYEENLISTIMVLRETLDAMTSSTANEASGTNSVTGDGGNRTIINKISIPQLPLPVYKHTKGEDLTKFFSEFEQIVDKYNMSEFEKYVYLKNQVSNEPATLLESLDSSERVYSSAKALLQEAFASEVVRKFNAVGALSNLKLDYCDDPYKYISSMRQIIQTFASLDIEIDDVLQYFIWTGLNDVMKSQLTAITNENRPLLNDISHSIFDATERYMNAIKADRSIKSKSVNRNRNYTEETVANAISVKELDRKPGNPKSKYCSLCSYGTSSCTSHGTYECPVYPTAEEKLSKLKQVGGCFKCAKTNHIASKCHFRFDQKCRKCSRYHFSYLCVSRDRRDKDSSVNIDTVFVGKTLLEQQYGQDSIVPTFSVTVKSRKLRVMRDSGCQPNFILQETADKLNLKVIDSNYPLIIKGFHTKERVKTNIVEIALVKSHPPITAVCVPKTLNIEIHLPGLSRVVREFDSKGYHLADDYLFNGTDVIDNLDMILGNIDAQILCQSEKTFGSKPCSIYATTPLGVVLCGGIKRFLKNIKSLPVNKCAKVTVKAATTKPSKTKAVKNFSEFFAFKVSIDSSNLIDNSLIDEAAEDILRQVPNVVYDSNDYPESNVEYDRLNEYVLRTTTHGSDGRLTAPLLWNEKMSHNLGTNFHLAKAVLHTNLSRLKGDSHKLKLYDEAIQDHVRAGVLKEIPNLPEYLKEHPSMSFLPHTPIYRMDKESTKCRVVLLSNLVQKGEKNAISHNQAMLCGANLNSKISTALTKLRFDSYFMGWDLQKAFLNVGLRETDQDRLVILSYKRIEEDKCKLVAYKYTRLPFGLRCSPCILMLCLYKILVEDAKSDDTDLKDLKALIYDLTYMDNCAVTSNDPNELKTYYEKLESIFSPYQFKLQQFVTNDIELNNLVHRDIDTVPKNPIKLLGMFYDNVSDSLFTEHLKLDANALTKRQVLSSIAKNYDVLQINCPLLNRARIFIHSLQCQKDLEWDAKISKSQIGEWINICKQCNNAPSLQIDRSCGPRNGSYELIAFTDASKLMLGTVLYMKNLETSKVTFLSSKNLIVSKQVENNTIPSLELHAMSHGVKHLIDTYRELCGDRALVPINIVKLKLYSDSMVALAWVNGHSNKLDKLQKLKTFVLNRLKIIGDLCETKPVEFHFIAGKENPADMVTRSVSHKLLTRSCYLNGPDFLRHPDSVSVGDMVFEVPNPLALSTDTNSVVMEAAMVEGNCMEHLISLDKYSDFYKLVRVNRLVHLFVFKLKSRIGKSCDRQNLANNAYLHIIKIEQSICFPDIIKFFESKNPTIIDTPPLINKFNLFLDSDNIVRVRCKFKEWKLNASGTFPILLPRDSTLTKLIVDGCHIQLGHSGPYCVISELRKGYFVPKIYSTVKKILAKCLICRRVNARTVKNNQSFYRNFRENPVAIPFQYAFLDHFGPYQVYVEGKKRKVWVLVITCLWSRAINLKVSYNMTVQEFLRCLQLHIYEFGIPQHIFSDLGSQLVAGANIVTDMLKTSVAMQFFDSYNMKVTEFDQYFKGKHELGGLVESLVKISKRLINGSIGNNVLKLVEFETLICQTTHLANKRPICFHESLRNTDVSDTEIPAPITPELLLRGFDTPSLSILPDSVINEDLSEWSNKEGNLRNIELCSKKLQKVRANLKQIYHEEFLGNLIEQAVNRESKYKPVTHKSVNTGDIVLLKDEFTKSTKFPMGRITKTYKNDLNEVTSVEVKKGNGEEVKRHVNSIIPYMSLTEEDNINPVEPQVDEICEVRPKRQAATIGTFRTRELYDMGLV